MADVIKVLGQAAPSATTQTTLYTVPSSTMTSISAIIVSSRSTTADTYRISVSSIGAATTNKDYIVYENIILNKEAVTLNLGLSLSSGDVVRVYASTANLSFSIFGQESTIVWELPVAGATAWYDAADTSSITDSSNAVSQWNDKSGNNYNVVQSSAGSKPTTNTNTQNGLNIISFDGGDYLQYSNVSLNISQPYTIFGVVKDNDSGATTGRYFIGSVDSTNTAGVATGSSTKQWFYFAGTVQKGSAADSSTHTMSAILNGSSSGYWKDGTSMTTSNPGTRTWQSGWTAGSIGNASANWWKGLIGELVFYSSSLSTGDRQSVETYLKNKWGTP